MKVKRALFVPNRGAARNEAHHGSETPGYANVAERQKKRTILRKNCATWLAPPQKKGCRPFDRHPIHSLGLSEHSTNQSGKFRWPDLAACSRFNHLLE